MTHPNDSNEGEPVLRRLLSDSVVYGGSRVLMMAVGFFLVPIYSHLFSREDYGVIETFNMFSSVALLVLPLGLSQAVYRFVYESEDKERQAVVYSTSFCFLVLVGVAFFALFYLFRTPGTSLLISDTRYTGLYVLTLVTIVFSLLNSYNLEVLRSQFQKYRYLVVSVGTALLLSAAGVYFVVWLRMGVYGFFYASILAQGLFFFIGYALNRRWLRLSLSWPVLRDLLSFGLPFIPAGLSLMLMKFCDRFIVQQQLGLDALGVYSMGVKIGSMFEIVTMAFSLAWFPTAMQIAQRPDAREKFRDLFLPILVILGIALVVFASIAPLLLRTLVDPKFWDASSVIYVFVLATAVSCMNYVFGLGIYISKQTRLIFVPTLLGGAANLVICFAFTSRWGLVAAAFSSLAGSAVYLLTSFMISQRHYRIDYDLRAGAVVVVAALAWSGLNYYGQTLPGWAESLLPVTLLVNAGILAAGAALTIIYRQAGARQIRTLLASE